ncbi:hypothetical protein NDU88_006856 [Pleurodeles waltl]|uniref:Uncharacterized protein n=1 Tax=Pleurodeles waltl TaxID=8319 RepID=A0AAV7PPP4_PLEWA|nr:hypothetical protein NDU88_006856 [Pleurodeles waltl]
MHTKWCGRRPWGNAEPPSAWSAGSDTRNTPAMRGAQHATFGTLREDIAELKRNIAAEVQDLRWDIDDLGQRVDNIERSSDAREEELETHSKELLELRDTNMELRYQLEDLENHSWRSNVRIKGVPIRAVPGLLEEYIPCLFQHVTPELAGQDIVLDRTHRAVWLVSSPVQPQDILTCLYYNKQKEAVMNVVHGRKTIKYEGTKVGRFQDLSLIALQRRKALRPLTEFL